VKSRRYHQSLQDIIDAAADIERFTAGVSLERLTGDRKTLFAVAKALENIGEAVKQIPAAVRRKYPDVPWKDMAGMRDVLVHDYFGVDAAIVWKTIQEDLPPLKRRIADILAAVAR
jgi:uncharacterized protein with HEPN domain